MSLLPAPRSGPLMPGRTAEDGIVSAWDTKLHKPCRRAKGMLFLRTMSLLLARDSNSSLLFAFLWSLLHSPIRIDKNWEGARTEGISQNVNPAVAGFMDEEPGNPSQWYQCADFIIKYPWNPWWHWWHWVFGALPLWSRCVWKLRSRWFLAQLGGLEIHHGQIA